MSIITRDVVNKNFLLKVLEADRTINTYDKQDIINGIDRAKTYLIEEKKVRPGQKIVLITNTWPYYLIWFLAAAELGLSFVVSDYPKLKNSFSVKKKLSLYGSLDLVIGDLEQNIWNYFTENEYQKVDIKKISYPSDKHKNEIWANDDSILIYSTSSGSTGTPKVIKHTHDFFYKLLERNAKIYKLSPQDKCLHSKGLHHGSVTGVYFLPTLKYCSNHYYSSIHDGSVPPKEWVGWIQEEHINRLFLMHDTIDYFVDNLKLKKKLSDQGEIYVLAPLKEDHIRKLTVDFRYKIWSIFGCTETSGPLFLPLIKHTDRDRKNMGRILDEFYKISINNNGLLEVVMPNGETVCTGDRFRIDKKDWIFEGRKDLYRLNGIPIYMDVLTEFIENFTKGQNQDFFDIVIDSEENKIYIRTNEFIDLDQLNSYLDEEIYLDSKKSYKIHQQIVEKREKFITGIKFDPEEIRLMCRQLNG